jgi:CrcB protein
VTTGPWLTVLVGVFAAIGAVLRYSVDRGVQRLTGGVVVPWGTMAVNASGSLVLGLVAGLAVGGHLGPTAVAVVGAGLCGGLTTFSTWSYETLRLLESGALWEAALNLGLSLLVGLTLAGGALALASRW